MITNLLKLRIHALCEEPTIVALKGFPVKTILELRNEFTILDDYVYNGEFIDLGQVNCMKLFQLIMAGIQNTCIISYESFLNFSKQFNNLEVLGKKFCVIHNNLLTNYPNPTNIDILDYDSPEFQDAGSPNEPYMEYYSFCRHKDGKQYVEYIVYQLEESACLSYEDFITPMTLNIGLGNPNAKYLCPDDDSITEELERIFYTGVFPVEYQIDANQWKNKKLGLIQQIGTLFYKTVTFHLKFEKENVTVRPELSSYLKNTWGYDSFRELQIYKDLSKNREVSLLSQGVIIETVIQQSEYAKQASSKMRNVLLTSPTGAGKSLLFQLAAIYLAEKYHDLTIVISPLVALMNDQVDNLVGNYHAVATLNGNKTAIEKEAIMDDVRSGKVNILYLAPELLLSYTITSFIGERHIGLVVVDEAHTVTTWGRDFRVDYWFLGDYLRQAKRILNYNFPIFALTATAVWDPSGKNDMVFDTIRSLYMDPCISYIGVVRRNDITFDINQVNIQNGYETQRLRLTVQRIKECIDNNIKTIVYFPFKSTIKNLMNQDEMEGYTDRVTTFHSSLFPAEKVSNAESFKTGKCPVICATKAYGMGVDVSDIKMVYHHAPTGSLSDYVQEIGRVARKEGIQGIAKIDFSEKDLKYINTLHGLSAIRSYQLRAVLKKVMALFRMKGEKRNMLISAEDFAYIFPGKDVDYDQKVKSCLLLISNDLKNKLQFECMIVRPKNLFSKAYLTVGKPQRAKFEREYYNYIKIVDELNGIYRLDADKLWEKKYVNISFPNFKRKLANNEIFKDYNVQMKNEIRLDLHDTTRKIRSELSEFFSLSFTFMDWMAVEHKRLPVEDLRMRLPKKWTDAQKEAFIESFNMVFASDTKRSDDMVYCKLQKFENGDAYQLVGQGYQRIGTTYLDSFDTFIKERDQVFYCNTMDRIVSVCELLNSLNLAEYERLGGEQPAIFLRINNPYYLNKLVREGNYNNTILDNVYKKFDISKQIFCYFFQTPMSNDNRWDFIEDYFLGTPVEQLLNY